MDVLTILGIVTFNLIQENYICKNNIMVIIYFLERFNFALGDFLTRFIMYQALKGFMSTTDWTIKA